MNVSTSTFQTRRRRLKKVEEEENAATLQLGQEFQLKQLNHQGEEEELIALNLSEARLVIKEALIERRRAFKRSQKKHKKKHLKHENANDETTAVEEEDDDLDEDDVNAGDDDFMHSETREKELESIDVLLEQTTGGNNKDLKNTMQYLTNFSRFRDQETVGAVIQLLKSTGLHPFEVAQLGSLACDTADEAKTLIPSLNNKISDDELERILKELSNLETLY
ncbi:DNA-directed RNA polymerase II subunit RPB4 [Saccharomyces paradoxus]|uniref:DNA-directed RNA polymerase II subunit RPB4 n=1 Tax=Saccharomyces paradoxus TaxID=27291 RepID=A0A8B8UTV9_SACPA|nr:Rpb4 [Saccharomyces paradoxus]QHS74119.1 Rpb4 [Saccharomyces paradoxus]